MSTKIPEPGKSKKTKKRTAEKSAKTTRAKKTSKMLATATNPEPATDPHNIEEIILKYWPQIRYRVIKSLGYNNPEWEDTASEILLSVVEALKFERFREESSIGTFIYSITSNKIVDAIRKKEKAMLTVEEPEKFLDPHNHIALKERAIYVADLIKSLKPRHADMLYLYYYIDLSQIQIAKIFGISSRRVHTILSDARKTLKRLVESS